MPSHVRKHAIYYEIRTWSCIVLPKYTGHVFKSNTIGPIVFLSQFLEHKVLNIHDQSPFEIIVSLESPSNA